MTFAKVVHIAIRLSRGYCLICYMQAAAKARDDALWKRSVTAMHGLSH